jgi:transposase-like protein
MSTDHIKQAIQLYQAGTSLVVVGAKLGYDHGTIYRALRKAGVSMRDSHGRHR